MPYTKEQEARLKTEAPITFESAQTLADEFGVSRGSVIAKTLSMDLPYIRKEAAPKRPAGVTKAELVEEIANVFGLDATYFFGLDKATAQALSRLHDAVNS